MIENPLPLRLIKEEQELSEKLLEFSGVVNTFS